MGVSGLENIRVLEGSTSLHQEVINTILDQIDSIEMFLDLEEETLMGYYQISGELEKTIPTKVMEISKQEFKKEYKFPTNAEVKVLIRRLEDKELLFDYGSYVACVGEKLDDLFKEVDFYEIFSLINKKHKLELFLSLPQSFYYMGDELVLPNTSCIQEDFTPTINKTQPFINMIQLGTDKNIVLLGLITQYVKKKYTRGVLIRTLTNGEEDSFYNLHERYYSVKELPFFDLLTILTTTNRGTAYYITKSGNLACYQKDTEENVKGRKIMEQGYKTRVIEFIF